MKPTLEKKPRLTTRDLIDIRNYILPNTRVPKEIWCVGNSDLYRMMKLLGMKKR